MANKNSTTLTTRNAANVPAVPAEALAAWNQRDASETEELVKDFQELESAFAAFSDPSRRDEARRLLTERLERIARRELDRT